MRFVTVRVDRSEHHKPVIDIGEWEIPLLQYEYAPEKVEILEVHVDARPYPEAQDEYARLSNRYGEDVESGAPKVALVYGQGMIGVGALRNMIEKAKAEEAEAVAAVANAQAEAEAAKAAEEARIKALVEARAAELVASERSAQKSTTLSLNK